VLAQSLFSDYLVAFEVTSVLLLVGVVGAVVLARRVTADNEPAPFRGGRS
jgi:NADH:ubiquinone oxidoreductase subunit 6 (subunit J)